MRRIRDLIDVLSHRKDGRFRSLRRSPALARSIRVSIRIVAEFSAGMVRTAGTSRSGRSYRDPATMSRPANPSASHRTEDEPSDFWRQPATHDPGHIWDTQQSAPRDNIQLPRLRWLMLRSAAKEPLGSRDPEVTGEMPPQSFIPAPNNSGSRAKRYKLGGT